MRCWWMRLVEVAVANKPELAGVAHDGIGAEENGAARTVDRHVCWVLHDAARVIEEKAALRYLRPRVGDDKHLEAFVARRVVEYRRVLAVWLNMIREGQVVGIKQ
jgi:hypothetical protein